MIHLSFSVNNGEVVEGNLLARKKHELVWWLNNKFFRVSAAAALHDCLDCLEPRIIWGYK